MKVGYNFFESNRQKAITLFLYIRQIGNLATAEYIKAANENFIEAKRRKAIALLDEDADELKDIDPELAQEYAETISYLETLSDEEYQTKKQELLQQVEVN